MTRARAALLATLVVVAAAAGIGYVLHKRSGGPGRLAAIMREPHVLFRNTELGPNYARVAVVPLSDPSGPRVVTPLTCDRVAMAGGVGVCGTTTVAPYASYGAKVFDPQYDVRGTVALVGAPDRVPRLARRAVGIGDAVCPRRLRGRGRCFEACDDHRHGAHTGSRHRRG